VRRAVCVTRARASGETLIELLVSITIMGSVVAVVVGALSSVVAGATGQRTDARAQAELVSFAQKAKATPLIPCATPAEYDARLGVPAVPAGSYATHVTRVASWDAAAKSFTSVTSKLTDGADETATTIKVALPFDVAPDDTIRVGRDLELETMTVEAVSGDTLTVHRATHPRAHAIDEVVTVCPLGGPDRSDLQLVDVSVAGPSTGVAGKRGPYASTISLAKRGPLLIPTLTTLDVTPPDQTAGGTSQDEARLTYDGTLPAGVEPSGTLTFKLFAASDATCSAPPVFTKDIPVTGFSADAYASTPYQVFFNTAGDGPGPHRWTVAYSGDAAFQGATSACGAPGQTLQLDKATPTLTPKVADPPAPDVHTGDPVSDTVTLADGVGPDPDGPGPGDEGPTGKISFELYGHEDPNCTGEPVFPAPDDSPVETVVDAGNKAYSLPTSPTPSTYETAGIYHWIATYSGDVNNIDVATECLDQPVTVTDAP
jgi:type II secretory pathway pseudopilin PulG